MNYKNNNNTEKIIFLIWSSWAGKTTIYEKISKTIPIKKITTFTTRKIRKNEKHWKDYYFTNKEDFFKNKKDFIEYSKVYWNFYWSKFSELEKIIKKKKIPTYIIDIQWFLKLKEKLKNKQIISIWIILLDEKENFKRLKKRGDEIKKIKERIKTIKQEEQKIIKNTNIVFKNKEFITCCNLISKYIKNFL